MANLGEMIAIMGCKVGNFPLTYLGHPLGAKYKSKEIWNPMIEKFEKKLAAWKWLYLSKDGKVTMLKNVFSNLLVHLLSLFSMLEKVLDRLEQIQRNFSWDFHKGDKKLNLVGWNQVCRPVE